MAVVVSKKRIGSIAGGLLVASLLGAGTAMAVDAVTSEPPVAPVPASECPEASAQAQGSGASLDTFSPSCPTAEELQSSLDRGNTPEIDSLEAAALSNFRAALRKAEANSLDANVDPGHAVQTLRAIISLYEDSEVTATEESYLQNNRANILLDKLRATGDFTDPGMP